MNATIKTLLRTGYQTDSFPYKVIHALKYSIQQSKQILLVECSENKGLLYYRQKLKLPLNNPLCVHILQQYHNTLIAGQPRSDKAFELISREFYLTSMTEFYLTNMRDYIGQYNRNCHTSKWAKPTTHGTHVVSRSLPISQQPWEEVSIDIVSGLPPSNGHHCILVNVNRLPKLWQLIPCHTTTDANQMATLYVPIQYLEDSQPTNAHYVR